MDARKVLSDPKPKGTNLMGQTSNPGGGEPKLIEGSYVAFLLCAYIYIDPKAMIW